MFTLYTKIKEEYIWIIPTMQIKKFINNHLSTTMHFQKEKIFFVVEEIISMILDSLTLQRQSKIKNENSSPLISMTENFKNKIQLNTNIKFFQ